MVSEVDIDVQYWRSLKKGEREALATIYQKYFFNLYEYGLRINSDKEVIRDCIHDLFVKLWTNRSGLGDVSNVKSYLFTALRGTIYNKAVSNNRVKLTEIEEAEVFEMNFSPETLLIQKEDVSEKSRKLLDALNAISARQKEIIYLKYIEELDYEEIAAIMGITMKGAYKLSARALDALREILNISKSSLIVLLALVREELFY